METLSPSILQVRNSFLEQFKNEQFENISKKLDQLFDVEKDPIKRIVLLASRVDTIRKRIELIYQHDNKIKKITEPSEDKKEEINTNDTEKNEKNRVPRRRRSRCVFLFDFLTKNDIPEQEKSLFERRNPWVKCISAFFS